MINHIFDWCVKFLELWAARLGMTYKEINVWVFCVIWPLFTVLLVVAVIDLRLRVRKLQRLRDENQRPMRKAA